MTNAEIAVNTFKNGFNCAQSVLSCFALDMALPKDLALRIATGFGGGMGRRQEVCGAVSAAVMVIGLIYGRGQEDPKDRQEKTYQKVREFFDKFEKKHGTVNCKELLSGCPLLTEAGQKEFKESNMIEKCHGYVRSACDILDELLPPNEEGR